MPSQSLIDPKYYEALWIKLMIELSLSNEFKDVIDVALLPMDGEFLKKIFHCKEGEGMSIIDLTDHLLKAIKQENSPFILPNMSQGDKETFARSVSKKVEDRYFVHQAKSKAPLLTKDEMMAFYGFFCSMASEELQFHSRATVVQRNCADGIDRTMALVGAELLDDLSRINKLEDPAVQEQFLGTVLGPALGTSKRELHHHREPMLFAVPKYMDQLRENIKLHPEEYKLGPAPTVQGYMLDDLVMNEEPAESLYKEPARAKDLKEYVDLLKFEQTNPCSLPKRVPAGSDLKETYKILNERYAHQKLNIRVKEINSDAAKTLINEPRMRKVVIPVEIENQVDHSVIAKLEVSVTFNPSIEPVKAVLSWRVTEVTG